MSSLMAAQPFDQIARPPAVFDDATDDDASAAGGSCSASPNARTPLPGLKRGRSGDNVTPASKGGPTLAPSPPGSATRSQRRKGATPSSGSSSLARAARAAAEPSEPAADSALASPERKIWMRPCSGEGCTEELHVRRTKCTKCGTIQVSKRAMENAKLAKSEVAAAAAAPDTDAEQAASALMLSASSPARVGGRASATADSPPSLARAAMPPPPGRAVPAVAARGGAGSARGAHLKAMAELMSKLTPEQHLKLRRMHKLKALLAAKPTPGGKARAKARAAGAAVEAAAPASEPNSALDALASVACM